ncbi:MAG: aminotransferase class I and II, partial [Candidatus Sericytochromatia bacterium]
DYVPGSITCDPLVPNPMMQDPQLASEIVWLDAFCSNVDRTARNANMLIWHKQLWLIDHGAALFFHHHWQDYLARSLSLFSQIKDHVLLPFASQLAQADAKLAPLLTPERLRAILALIPDQWLGDVPAFESVAAHREAYLDYFLSRLQGPRKFIEEAQHAHLQL